MSAMEGGNKGFHCLLSPSGGGTSFADGDTWVLNNSRYYWCVGFLIPAQDSSLFFMAHNLNNMGLW